MNSELFRHSVDVPCTIDIAHTPEEFHAHVTLDGIEVGPGDEVLVHGAPDRVGYGTQVVLERRATVVHAGWLQRLWTRMCARFELTLLYEVSFSPERSLTASARTRR
jgi:hypothetical protein